MNCLNEKTKLYSKHHRYLDKMQKHQSINIKEEIIKRQSPSIMFGQISLKHQLKTCVLSKPNILKEDPHAKEKPIYLLVRGAEEPVAG